MRPVEVRVAVERAGSVAPAVVEDADVDVEVVLAVVVAPLVALDPQERIHL
jgi:hypothetical protein